MTYEPEHEAPTVRRFPQLETVARDAKRHAEIRDVLIRVAHKEDGASLDELTEATGMHWRDVQAAIDAPPLGSTQ